MSDSYGDHPQPAQASHRIRSYVLRQGRITPAQERAFDLHWPLYGLEYRGRPHDFAAVFGRKAPLILELGFGNGEQLLHAAAHEPEHDFIGIEVHRPGVGRLMNTLAEAELENVRIFQHDGVQVLEDDVAPASLQQVRVYFPDPWHKKKHHHRRLIQPGFVELLASRVVRGGHVHLATDIAEYAYQMHEVLEASPNWRSCACAGERFITRPPWRIQTHFETRGLRLGHTSHDLLYQRN